MWAIDAIIKPAMDVLREGGTLLFLMFVIEKYQESPYKQKLKRWLRVWYLVFIATLLVQVLLSG